MESKVLISLAVGALIGVGAAILLRPTPRLTTVLTVTSQAPNSPRLSANPVSISASTGQVQWQAIPSTMTEYIEFEQRVFTNADPYNGRYRVKCSGGICDSGAPLATMPTQPADGYKYWYGLKDSTSNPIWGSDGHIIIRP